MKSNIFLVAIFLLIAGGIYMFINHDNVGTTTLNQEAIEEEENLPPSEWQDALIGTWGFSTSRKSSKVLHYFSGEVEYLADGTFIRHVTHKFHIPYSNDRLIGNEKHYPNKLAIVAGGSVKGRWKVSSDEGMWTETITGCTIVPSFTLADRREHKGYSTCKKDFSGVNQYGTYSTDKSKFSLDGFRGGKINISGKNFKEGSYVTHTMWKSVN